MKKLFLSLLLLAIGYSVMAQQKIQLRSTDNAECIKSDMKSLKASFSFATIEAEDSSLYLSVPPHASKSQASALQTIALKITASRLWYHANLQYVRIRSQKTCLSS